VVIKAQKCAGAGGPVLVEIDQTTGPRENDAESTVVSKSRGRIGVE
jgi:hypothetical protein